SSLGASSVGSVSCKLKPPGWVVSSSTSRFTSLLSVLAPGPARSNQIGDSLRKGNLSALAPRHLATPLVLVRLAEQATGSAALGLSALVVHATSSPGSLPVTAASRALLSSPQSSVIDPARRASTFRTSHSGSSVLMH